MAGLPLVGALAGLCIGGPIGLLAGAKLGGVAGVGCSLLGYAGARAMEEKKDVRKHIDEYYKKEPSLYVQTPKEDANPNKRRIPPRTPTDLSRNLPALGRKSPSSYRRKLTSRSCTSLSSSTGTRGNKHNITHSHSQVVIMSRKQGGSKKEYRMARKNSYRRLGDLTKEEQRSVLALITNQSRADGSTGIENRLHFGAYSQCETKLANPKEYCRISSVWRDKSTQEKRRNFSTGFRARSSSLPDVLEEAGSFSVKSFSYS